jgi:glycosyltransferase involved in cell wall biosynthesis
MDTGSAHTERIQYRKFVVVAWSGAVPIHLSPRGQRARHLVSALREYGNVERVGGSNIPQWLAGSSERMTSSWYRQLARRIVYSVLIDKYEFAVWRELRSWHPHADAAVLVAYPCSPLSIAARKLTGRSIPYIVDIGDPWILTNPTPEGGRLRKWRAKRQERKLWNSAVGAIVTTETQGDALKDLFPHLRVLVRPNGYRTNDEDLVDQQVSAAPAHDTDELHLVHYGSLYGERVNFGKIFRSLAMSGRWKNIILHQYGSDWENMLSSISDCCEIRYRPPITWSEVLSGARMFHAAIVIGWCNPRQMPSKAVQYLTLPIPRLAMVTPDSTDALARYVADKPGWILVNDEDDDVAQIIADHVSKPWADADLEAPDDESWANVERVLGAFISSSTEKAV